MAFSLTVKEAAERLGVSPARVYQLVQSGALAAERVGNQLIIDTRSVEARLENKPATGRPARKAPEDTAYFMLMNGDHEVLEFSYSMSADRFVSVSEIKDASRAPLGVVSPRGKSASRAALSQWWAHRSIPVSRQDVDEKLRELGLAGTAQIPFESLGLSLSDQYWIRPDGMSVSWRDINFFQNDFPGMSVSLDKASLDWLANVGLDSPDNTSDGELPKKWIRQDGVPTLVKGGGPLGQEPYNEVVACALYRRLLDPSEYVTYEQVDSPRGALSCCADFVGPGEEFIPAFYVLQIKRKPNHFNEFFHYIDCCASLGVDDVAKLLEKMIVCDDILANHDRHWRNFGLVRNVDTLEYRPAPLFDNGSSLWCNVDEAVLLRGDFPFSTKPFYEDPKRQLRLVNDFSWLDFSALDGFADEARDILMGNPALERRLDAICRGIQLRIDRLARLVS